MALVNLLMGFALLVWGRKLFWLFIAAAGFVTGLQLADRAFSGPAWLGIVIGIIFALIGAALALFVRKVAIVVAGFLAGGSALLSLAGMLGFDTGLAAWVIYILGGIGGAIIVSAFFDWAVILLSSVGGAAIAVDAFGLADRPIGWILLLALIVFGIVVQGRQMKQENR